MESKNVDVGGAIIRGIRYAVVQSDLRHVETVVGVSEHLLEIVHPHQRLRHEARRNHSIIDQREIVHAAGGGLEVVGHGGADVFGLIAGATEVADSDIVPLVKLMIQLDHAVVTVGKVN